MPASQKELLLGVAALSCYLIFLLNKRKKKQRSQWSKNWLQRRKGRGTLALLNKELVIEDPEAYKNFLRMDENHFTYLLNLVKHDIEKQDTFMRESISAKDRLNITLRFLATGESYRSLMYSTRVHESTISKIIPETCRAICTRLKGLFLKTPKSNEEWIKVAQDYQNKWNFPHCIGALDGRHIAFSSPISAGSYYHNYKGTNSIVLLGLVDANYKFIYANVGVNGRVSDGGVFSACKLYIKIQNQTLNLPQSTELPGRQTKLPYVIIADDAFPLMENLMKPYPQRDLTYQNRIFNYRLSRARRMVECAFGILVNRWRVLSHKMLLAPEKVELITLTCVILHNFLITESVTYFKETEEEFNTGPSTVLSQVSQQIGNKSKSSARAIREEFKHFFNSELGSVPWQDDAVQRGNY